MNTKPYYTGFKSYNGSRMINFLMSFSVVVITMVSGCFKNTNKLINAVIDKTRKTELSRALKLSARNCDLIQEVPVSGLKERRKDINK